MAKTNPKILTAFWYAHEAEEAARFVHVGSRASRTGPWRVPAEADEDRFYGRVLQEALAYFGSRALYPARPPVRESDLYALYSRQPHEVEIEGCGYGEYMQLVDFLVLHKDYEANCRYYRQRPDLLDRGVRWRDERF